MNNLYNYNGTIGTLKDSNFNGYNRAFKYGDGIIETIRIFDSKPIFFENHYSRIQRSSEVLQFDIPNISDKRIFEEIKVLCSSSKISNGVVRLEVYRTGGGAYIPESNSVDFLMSISELNDDLFKLNDL